MKKSILFLASCIILGLTACDGNNAQTTAPANNSDSSSQTDEQSQSGILSKFTATDLDGNEVTQDIFKDYSVTMVNVWGTFCTPCISEMPDLGELANEYKDKDFQIIGLVSDVLASDGSISSEQISLAQEIVQETSATYTHIVPSEDLYSLLYQITSVPTTFFVDENGNQVGNAYLGAKDKSDWQAIVDELL